MMNVNFLKNAFHTPGILFTLLRNVKRQRKFLHKNLDEELAEAKRTNDGSLDESDFEKITEYYGLAVPAILGEALCVLRGKRMTLRERLTLTYQGAITGLFDDFFDKHFMPNDLLMTMIEKPAELTGNSSSEKLFLNFYKKAIELSPDPSLMFHYLKQVYEVQIETRKQAVPALLTKDEIERITIHKGAVSVLFYRSVLLNKLSKEEEKALYQVGGLMQLGNDIFDIYKDCLKKIDTPLTTAKKVNDMRELFKLQLEKSFSLFYKTSYPHKNIKRFLQLIHMSLCSRCFVCLDQLEKKEKETNGQFLPFQYTRKDIVCDMQKVKNKWKTVLYHIRNHKSRITLLNSEYM